MASETIHQVQKKLAEANNVISYAIEMRTSNTQEFMDGMVEQLNKYAELIGHDERFKFDGNGLRRVAVEVPQ